MFRSVMGRGAIACGCVLIAFAETVAVLAQGGVTAAQQARDSVTAADKAKDYAGAARAAAAYTDALERQYGPQAPETAQGYVLEATYLLKAGQLTDARQARTVAVGILRSTATLPAQDRALLLTALAAVSTKLQDLPLATTLVSDALQAFSERDTELAKEQMASVRRIVDLSIAAGRIDNAANAHALVAAVASRVDGEESRKLVPVLEQAASFLEEQGRYADAADAYDTFVACWDKLRGPADASVAMGLHRSAACRVAMGQYAEAEKRLRRARSTAAPIVDAQPVLQLEIMDTLANACGHQGKWEQAEEYARESISAADRVFADEPERTLPYRITLATVYALQERNAEAEKVVRQALAITEHSTDALDINVLTALSNLGFLVWTTGRHDDADKIFRRALTQAESEFGEENPNTAMIRSNYACNCFYQGRYDEAADLLTQSLKVTRTTLGDDHLRTAMALINLATTEAARGNVQRAAKLNDEGCRGYARQIRGQLATVSPREQLRILRGQYAIGYQAALTMGLLWKTETGMPERSAGWLANGKAIAHEASARRAAAAFNLQRDTTEERMANPERGNDRWVELAEVRRQIPRDAVLIDIARFDVFNYASRKKGEDWKPARYAAWIIPPAGMGEVKVVDLGDAATNDADIAAYRAAVRDIAVGGGSKASAKNEREAEQALVATAEPIVTRVLTPILEGVRAAGCGDDLEELIISPDAELWFVPWAALPLPDGSYLVERYAISTLTSARDLIPVDREDVKPTAPRVFADPDYDLSLDELAEEVNALAKEDGPGASASHALLATDGAGLRSATADNRYERLPGSLAEAVRVGPLLSRLCGERPGTFTGARAIEERVKESRSPYVLHFATHGFCFPDQVASSADAERATVLGAAGRPIQGLTADDGSPLEEPLLRCGLMLAGCNAGVQEAKGGLSDGCLTGQEVIALDLRDTKLVILSACDTGLGRVQYGEGVAGLRQAFLIAGAESVLANLWPVRDDQAEQAVVAFLAKLADGGTKAAALQGAQCEMIKNRRASGGAAHPAFWAAFELTGR